MILKTAQTPPPGDLHASRSFHTRKKNQKSAALSKNEHSLQIINILKESLGSPSSVSAFAQWYQITSSEGVDLKKAFKKLDPSRQDEIIKTVGKPILRIGFAIGQNSDPELFASDLYRFGLHLEKKEKFLMAASTYRAIQIISPSEKWSESAKRRLEILQGGGTKAERLEFQANQFIRNVTDPVGLAAMFGAGLTFRLARFGIVRSLAASGIRAPILKGIGTFGAFALEATSFPLYGRLGGELLGRNVDWNSETLKRDIASSFLIFGGLRAFGGLARRGFTAVHRVNPITGQATRWTGALKLNRNLFTQAGMFTGIVAGHKAEEFFGLRKPTDESLLLDSLVTLLHFNIAGNLIRRLTPEGLQKFEHNLEIGSELLTKPLRVSFFEPVTPEGIRANDLVVMMSSQKDGGYGTIKVDSKPYISPLIDVPGKEAIVRQLSEVSYHPHEYFNIVTNGGGILWALPTRRCVSEYKHLFTLVADNLQNHPSAHEFLPWMERIDQTLNSILYIFDRVETFPEPKNPKSARETMRTLFICGNRMTNFINSGHVDDLKAVALNAERALESVRKAFRLPKRSLGKKAKKFSPPLLHVRLDLTRDSPELIPRDYLIDDTNERMTIDIPTRDNRVLVLGDLEGLRSELFTRQLVDVVQREVQPLYDLEIELGLMGEKDRTRLLLEELWKDEPDTYPYLEAYDLAESSDLKGTKGEQLIDGLLRRLEPGGVGYLVSRDQVAMERMIAILSKGDRSAIIEGAFQTPLPVSSSRKDASNSNYLFLRKLPYSE